MTICHPECLTLDGVDCENDPSMQGAKNVTQGSGHHAEDGGIDCDDVSTDVAGSDTSSACDASFEEACMAYCHWITNNQDPDFVKAVFMIAATALLKQKQPLVTLGSVWPVY